MTEQTLSGIDYFAMIAYMVATVIIGIYLARNMRTGKDFFLAGRRLPWWAIGMSMVVTDIGAIDIVGIAGSAYLYGMVMGNYDWIGSVPVIIIAGFVFIPYFWRSEVYTIPEFLGRRFNDGVRIISALIWCIFLACNLGLMLYATGVLLTTMLGWPLWFSILMCSAAVGIYTFAGGLAAVVYTDVLQCIVMFVGCIFTLVLGLREVGGFSGLYETIQNLGPAYQEHFSLIRPVDTETPHPWSGILFGLAMVLAPAYWFGNQAIVQRSLGARSEFEAKAAFVWAALLKTLIPIVIVIPGIIALAHNPNIPADQSDRAMPSLIRDILPSGPLGIFFAAFLASFLSSIDSTLNSVTTLITKDVYQRYFRPNEPDQHYLYIGRYITVITLIWGILFAFWVQGRNNSLYNIIQTMLSLFQGPSFAVILLGVLWWRATGIAALTGLIGGLVTSTGLFAINSLATEPIFQIDNPFNYIALWSFLVAVTLTVVISWLTPPEPPEKLVGLVYKYAIANPEKPKND